jgi:hypothetical protein
MSGVRRKPNPVAKDLRTPKYKLRVLKDKRKQSDNKRIEKEIDNAKRKDPLDI